MAKVLYATESIAPYVTGGMQEVARRHIQYLRDAGHDVIGLHSRVEHEVPYDDVHDLIHIPWKDKSRWRYPGKYVEQLRLYSQKVAEWILREKPEVIYAEGPVVDVLLRAPNRPPIIFHPHGLEVFQKYSSWLDNLRSYPLKLLILKHCMAADYVISQGGRLTGILTGKAKVPEHKIRILPNTFDGPLAEPKKTPNGSLLFVGREEKRKGLNLLLDVVAEFPELMLDVVGSSKIDGAPENVRFLGVIRGKEHLLKIYRETRVLMLPSLAEGMPTVILEAMSQGTPVIGSDVGAVSELVINNCTGWCVESGSREALRRAINEMLSITDQDYHEMSLRCIDLLRERFSENVVRPLLCNIVDEAVGVTKNCLTLTT